ncbi:disease resistance protein RPM1-like [Impatiens glandulifera]|uniref:disease resistance protein RPM1-like n=1 Tax=Impatiens glandulifera TaxID=253017 RepID=UPI001FB0E5C9|nr:disease resistance protein RPM1-like [Impatiens glandulifera]
MVSLYKYAISYGWASLYHPSGASKCHTILYITTLSLVWVERRDIYSGCSSSQRWAHSECVVRRILGPVVDRSVYLHPIRMDQEADPKIVANETKLQKIKQIFMEMIDKLTSYMNAGKSIGLILNTLDSYFEFLLLLTPPSHHFLRAQIFHLQNLRTRHLLSEKIKLISLKTKGIKERRETFSLPSTSHEHEYLGGHAWRLDALFVQDTGVVGIDDSKSQLSTLLNVEDKNLFIVTVVGMGGVGKTTLVKKVYESRAVKENFDCRAWITVSQSFTIPGLLRASLKSFKGELKEGSDDEEWLINTLNNYLQQKRYIIVLDDIWSVGAWNSVRYAFPCCSCGSRIIFTTRNSDIASSTETTNRIFNLNPLSNEESWILFCKKAFRGEEYKSVCPEEMHNISWSLMKKCGGLPLAVVALGGLLATKEKQVLGWKKILESLSPKTRIITGLESLESILLLSFNDLPNSLKCCIFYTSMFPEDQVIKRSRLIRLWVSEGFAEDKLVGYTREEVAEGYLIELVNRNMVQSVSKNFFNFTM